MSVRPSTPPPEFATDPGAAIVAPNPSDAEAGFDPGDPLPAQFVNWQWNLTFLWLQHFADLAFEGDMTLDGNLDVDGDVTITGELASGPATVGDLSAANAEFSGDVEITGDLYHSDRVLEVHAVAGQGTGDWSIANNSTGYWSANGGTAGGRVLLPVSLRQGDRLKSIALTHRAGDLDHAVELQSISSVGVGSGVSGWSTSVNAPTAGSVTTTLNGPDYEIGAGEMLMLEIQIAGVTPSDDERVFGMRVTYDRPAP